MTALLVPVALLLGLAVLVGLALVVDRKLDKRAERRRAEARTRILRWLRLEDARRKAEAVTEELRAVASTSWPGLVVEQRTDTVVVPASVVDQAGAAVWRYPDPAALAEVDGRPAVVRAIESRHPSARQYTVAAP